ncbi:MAG: PAS domain-containing protein [Bdellovibrionales bacterium]|nr:PAS domain-containing protein [Bdellovibrionales bacterium]
MVGLTSLNLCHPVGASPINWSVGAFNHTLLDHFLASIDTYAVPKFLSLSHFSITSPAFQWLLAILGFVFIFLVAYRYGVLSQKGDDPAPPLTLELDDLIKNVPGIIYRCDCNADWTMNFISQSIESITGYPPSDFINDRVRSFGSIIHSEDKTYVFNSVLSAIENGESFEISYRVIAKDGSIKHVFERGQKVELSGGLVEKLDGFIIDMTEKVEYEQRMLNERSKSIQASKLATLGEMAAGVAHEINNPLAVISGSANILPRHIQLGELNLAYDRIEKINRSVQRIAKIISGLQNFSRSSEHQKRSLCNLEDIITESISIAEIALNRQKVKITTDLDVKTPIYCDPLEIEQVLVNLINNAKDAMEGKQDRWLHIKAYEENQQIRIEVSDSGAGVSSEHVQEIFHPFFTTKPLGKGTGLGLSISLGIIKSHGGELVYVPERAHTTFLISFQKVPDHKVPTSLSGRSAVASTAPRPEREAGTL